MKIAVHAVSAMLLAGLIAVGVAASPRAAWADGAPANDNFANREMVDVPGTASGTTVGATTEAGERSHACGATYTATVWFAFTADASGTVDIELPSGTYQGAALYKGTALDSLTRVTCASNAEVHWTGPVRAGVTYAIVVVAGPTGFGEPSPFTLSISFTASGGNDNFADRETITVPAAGDEVIVAAGDTTSATVEPDEPSCSSSRFRTVWYEFTAPGDGTLVMWLDEPSPPDFYGHGFAVFTGSTLASLTQIACTPLAEPFATFEVQRGNTYAVVVGVHTVFDEGPFDLIVDPELFNLHDDFADKGTIAVPGSADGTTSGATSEPGEPVPSCMGSQRPTAWYGFTPPSRGVVHIDLTGGSSQDRALAVYSGATLQGLTEIACTNSGADSQSVAIPAMGGTAYALAVMPLTDADAGPFRLDLSFVPSTANDDFADKGTITVPGSADGTTSGATSEPGEPVPSCVGSQRPTAWYGFTPPSRGVVRIDLTGGSSQDRALAVYRGATLQGVTEIACTNNGAALQSVAIPVMAGTAYALAVMPLTDADAGPFRLDLSFVPSPANDDFKAKINVKLEPATTATVSGSTAGATREPGEAAATCSPTAGTVWYRFKPTQDGTLLIDASSMPYNAVVRVFEGRSLPSLQEKACFRANDGDDLPKRLPMLANTVHAIAVAGPAWLKPTGFELSLTWVPVVSTPAI